MQISKEDAAKYLRNIGYKADVCKGVVTVYMDEGTIISTTGSKVLREVRKTLQGIGYTASVGVRVDGRKHEETGND